jgi:UDP-2,3-diacylglucosamine pyrophosphatase LpxH
MLVIVSDLHLVDGTAGDHNVSADAFELFRDDIAAMARDRGVKEVELLLLGDVVDLLRTEAWFDVEAADRPWGNPYINDDPRKLSAACGAKGVKIVEAIQKHAKDQIAALCDSDKKLEGQGLKLRRTFIPGNHDRLYGVVPEIKSAIDAMLQIDEPAPFESPRRVYRSDRYRVLARHGHELDVWNFEAFRKDAGFKYDDAEYLKTPIGDAITTELVVALPYRVRRALKSGGVAEELVEKVYHRLQDIENVRPLSAAIGWIFYQISALGANSAWNEATQKKIAAIVEETTADVFDDFMNMPFVKRWLSQHDKWTDPMDEADKLQALHGFAKRKIGLGVYQYFLKHFDIDAGNQQRDGAAREPALSDGIQHIIYGHTHQYDQVALAKSNGLEQVYFNSGTWRPRHHATLDQKDFVEWKDMTYLVFYDEGEDQGPSPKQGTSFETWMGTRFKRPMRTV